ncbi:amidohydrolase [Pedobacter yulinensis]|uniref:Amidohydrolase n=1 Tax=Pedobacter yulinensis TaxID=2126353 RepID=A0A2T3HQE2_9SPHI|nr:amidohydrolase family protein [Pedobacter yulinensis]PST84680.1 amidohydrolase [Pedobacter yulinensis]
MVRYFSADKVYPVTSAPLERGVVGMEADGRVAGVWSEADFDAALGRVERHRGALVPGFVNTHCHLELSHLRGKFPRHTGLPGFVQLVMSRRGAGNEEIGAAMLAADDEMHRNGIVAVGDISNNAASRAVKLESRLHYHTFVEALGFNPARAAEIFASVVALERQFAPLSVSIVPHAPYSVSQKLFALLGQHAMERHATLSIHNQETADENLFFQKKQGEFVELYEKMGLDLAFFEPPGLNSLPATVGHLPATQKQLLVHNTFTTEADYRSATARHSRLYWCLCPAANRYIENRLPDVAMLERLGARITLGTDSLASNTELNILAEMKILQEEAQIPLANLLCWATWNGAEFLGLSDWAGSLENGKKPGLNLIPVNERSEITGTRVLRLA